MEIKEIYENIKMFHKDYQSKPFNKLISDDKKLLYQLKNIEDQERDLYFVQPQFEKFQIHSENRHIVGITVGLEVLTQHEIDYFSKFPCLQFISIGFCEIDEDLDLLKLASIRALFVIDGSYYIGDNKLDAATWDEILLKITDLTNLKSLHIMGNEIDEIPDSIGKLENLEELLIKSSKIERLPDSIKNCKKLYGLNISSSELISLPDCFDELYNLKFLDLSCNNLKELPKSIIIPQLYFFNYLGNNWNPTFQTLFQGTLSPAEYHILEKISGCGNYGAIDFDYKVDDEQESEEELIDDMNIEMVVREKVHNLYELFFDFYLEMDLNDFDESNKGFVIKQFLKMAKKMFIPFYKSIQGQKLRLLFQ